MFFGFVILTMSFFCAGAILETTLEMQEAKPCIVPKCPHPIQPRSSMCSVHNNQVAEMSRTSFSSKLAARRESKTTKGPACGICDLPPASGSKMCDKHRAYDGSLQQATMKRKYSSDSESSDSDSNSECDTFDTANAKTSFPTPLEASGNANGNANVNTQANASANAIAPTPTVNTSYLSEQDLARFTRLQQDQIERQRHPNTVPADVPNHSQSRCYVCDKELRGNNKVLGVCWEHQKLEMQNKRRCYHPGGCSLTPRNPLALFCHKHCNIKKKQLKEHRKEYDANRRQRQCFKGIDLDKEQENLENLF